MTQNELIDMFRMSDKDLDVEEIVNFAVKWEREECARACEFEAGDGPDNGCCPTYWNEAQEACAAAVRARGKA